MMNCPKCHSAYHKATVTDTGDYHLICQDCGHGFIKQWASDWTPIYSPWRHGGWYVHNVRYASGACGCVSNNFADKKWRIVCDPRPGSYYGGPDDHTYSTRDAAARAEYAIAKEA